MITINNLIKSYPPNFKLEIENLHFEKGQLVAIMGNNGVGKTTLLNIILNFTKPENGIVLINGESNDKEKWRRNTSCFLGSKYLLKYLTIREYFLLLASLNEISKEQIMTDLDNYKDFFQTNLKTFYGKRIDSLSQGNMDKIGIVASLIFNSNIIILDEPFSHLDPSSRHFLSGMLNRIVNYENATIIVSSHEIYSALDISSRYIVMEEGEILHDIEASIENRHIIQNYFKQAKK